MNEFATGPWCAAPGHDQPAGRSSADATGEAGRWGDLIAMASDLAFETGPDGCLSFVSPADPLGWPGGLLLGKPPAALLAQPEGGWDPFRPTEAVRGRRAWLRRADGVVRCFSISCAPLVQGGQIVGSRGIARDVSTQDNRDSTVAAALRRGEVVEHILWQMRQEVLAPRMMQAMLEGLSAALGADGAVVLDLLAGDDPGVLHQVGADPAGLLAALGATLGADTADAVTRDGPGGERLLACPSYTRFGGRAGLALWRGAAAPPWDRDDALLAGATTTIVRMVLEHEAIQHELARQARTDPLTGLLNRRSFLEEVSRRIDRLDRESLPGCLMYVDLDGFKQLNDGCGHKVGDEALVLCGTLLRATVRPTDLVARLGGDEFAMWMDSADTFTAAERAERLRLEAPLAFAQAMPPGAAPLSMSIGIAAREPGYAEAIAEVMRRADEVMYQVKRSGGGHWRTANAPLLT